MFSCVILQAEGSLRWLWSWKCSFKAMPEPDFGFKKKYMFVGFGAQFCRKNSDDCSIDLKLRTKLTCEKSFSIKCLWMFHSHNDLPLYWPCRIDVCIRLRKFREIDLEAWFRSEFGGSHCDYRLFNCWSSKWLVYNLLDIDKIHSGSENCWSKSLNSFHKHYESNTIPRKIACICGKSEWLHFVVGQFCSLSRCYRFRWCFLPQ